MTTSSIPKTTASLTAGSALKQKGRCVLIKIGSRCSGLRAPASPATASAASPPQTMASAKLAPCTQKEARPSRPSAALLPSSPTPPPAPSPKSSQMIIEIIRCSPTAPESNLAPVVSLGTAPLTRRRRCCWQRMRCRNSRPQTSATCLRMPPRAPDQNRQSMMPASLK